MIDLDRLDDLQLLIDTGDCWKLEGAAGRAAMDALRGGDAVLGAFPTADYYGNPVPAWWQVEPGTPGSPENCDGDLDEHVLAAARKRFGRDELTLDEARRCYGEALA